MKQHAVSLYGNGAHVMPLWSVQAIDDTYGCAAQENEREVGMQHERFSADGMRQQVNAIEKDERVYGNERL